MWRSGIRLSRQLESRITHFTTRTPTIVRERCTYQQRWTQRQLCTQPIKPVSSSNKIVDETADVSIKKSVSSKANEMITIPRSAKILGFGGVIPFVSGAVGTLFFADPLPIARALQLYGSSILSFLGAVHWGVALRTSVETGVTSKTVRDLVYGVTPSLVAWGGSLMQPSDGLYVLVGSFGVAYVYDVVRFGAGSEIPAWYRQLRLPLTLFAIVSCFIGQKCVSRKTVEVGLCPRGTDSTIVETKTNISNKSNVKLQDTPQHITFTTSDKKTTD